MIIAKKTTFFVVALFTSSLLISNFSSTKAQAGSSFFGGFVVGAVAGVVVSHVIHNEWHKSRRSYKRTASAKQQSALPLKSSSATTSALPKENITTVAKSSGPLVDTKDPHPSPLPTSALVKNQ